MNQNETLHNIMVTVFSPQVERRMSRPTCSPSSPIAVLISSPRKLPAGNDCTTTPKNTLVTIIATSPMATASQPLRNVITPKWSAYQGEDDEEDDNVPRELLFTDDQDSNDEDPAAIEANISADNLCNDSENMIDTAEMIEIVIDEQGEVQVDRKQIGQWNISNIFNHVLYYVTIPLERVSNVFKNKSMTDVQPYADEEEEEKEEDEELDSTLELDRLKEQFDQFSATVSENRSAVTQIRDELVTVQDLCHRIMTSESDMKHRVSTLRDEQDHRYEQVSTLLEELHIQLSAIEKRTETLEIQQQRFEQQQQQRQPQRNGSIPKKESANRNDCVALRRIVSSNEQELSTIKQDNTKLSSCVNDLKMDMHTMAKQLSTMQSERGMFLRAIQQQQVCLSIMESRLKIQESMKSGMQAQKQRMNEMDRQIKRLSSKVADREVSHVKRVETQKRLVGRWRRYWITVCLVAGVYLFAVVAVILRS